MTQGVVSGSIRDASRVEAMSSTPAGVLQVAKGGVVGLRRASRARSNRGPFGEATFVSGEAAFASGEAPFVLGNAAFACQLISVTASFVSFV